MPKIDRELPIRAKFRTESDEPNFEKSKIDPEDPNRIKLRIEREEPNWAKSKTDTVLPI